MLLIEGSYSGHQDQLYKTVDRKVLLTVGKELASQQHSTRLSQLYNFKGF